jgi:hypothetical protein
MLLQEEVHAEDPACSPLLIHETVETSERARYRFLLPRVLRGQAASRRNRGG